MVMGLCNGFMICENVTIIVKTISLPTGYWTLVKLITADLAHSLKQASKSHSLTETREENKVFFEINALHIKLTHRWSTKVLQQGSVEGRWKLRCSRCSLVYNWTHLPITLGNVHQLFGEECVCKEISWLVWWLEKFESFWKLA